MVVETSPRPDPSKWVWTGKGFSYPTPLEDHLGILPIENLLQWKKQVFAWDQVVSEGSGGWVFPGFGEAYSTCGHFYTVGCLDHEPAYIKRKVHNCGRSQCPVCHKSWLVKSAHKIADRIERAKPYYRKPIHITSSPPVGEWDHFMDKEQFSKIRRKSNRLIKRVGFHGGCSVFHPYRKKCPVCGSGESEFSEKCPKCGNEMWAWVYSPHFHYVGYGWIHGTARNYRGSGWVVKNIGVRTDVGAVAYYILSHSGYREGNNIVTWIGSLSWYHFRVEPELEGPEVCPVCGAYLVPVIWRGIGDNPMCDPEGPASSRDYPSYCWEHAYAGVWLRGG